MNKVCVGHINELLACMGFLAGGAIFSSGRLVQLECQQLWREHCAGLTTVIEYGVMIGVVHARPLYEAVAFPV